MDVWQWFSKVAGENHTRDHGREEEDNAPPNAEPQAILREEQEWLDRHTKAETKLRDLPGSVYLISI